jgi:p-cumate 2,3-dioxygenase subunit beta
MTADLANHEESGDSMIANAADCSRTDVEDFLFREARLLDEWKLDEWLALFLPEGQYLVPSLDTPEMGPDESLYLILDDMNRLRSRVRQYDQGTMWVEEPRSRTRRLLANVEIRAAEAQELRIAANFVVYRMRNKRVDSYVGHYEHVLELTEEGIRFRERKAILDLEVLKPQGKISFIL